MLESSRTFRDGKKVWSLVMTESICPMTDQLSCQFSLTSDNDHTLISSPDFCLLSEESHSKYDHKRFFQNFCLRTTASVIIFPTAITKKSTEHAPTCHSEHVSLIYHNVYPFHSSNNWPPARNGTRNINRCVCQSPTPSMVTSMGLPWPSARRRYMAPLW